MPKGVEKIVVLGNVNPFNSPLFNVTGGSSFDVKAVYYSGTPADLESYTKWIVKAKNDTPFSKNDWEEKSNDRINVLVKPKYCGLKPYVVEAFLYEPTNKYPAQLTFMAFAPQKIISTKWSKTNGGGDIRQSPIKYGEHVWLNVETEGLNGTTLEVDVWNMQKLSDELVCKIRNVRCINGEVNLCIKNTYTWRNSTGLYTGEIEKFYIKIRLKGSKETLKDNKGDDIHARFIRIKDAIETRKVEKHIYDRPTTIGESEVDIKRYEPCKFEKITVTDDDKDIVLFDDGSLLGRNQKKREFQASETIHFDVDKSIIRNDAKKILGGIVRLLLNNPFVPAELGAHCDIRGDDEYNDSLSQRRAKAAVRYLISKGISKKRISARGYGKRRLLIKGENISEEEHQQNRRVTIRFKIFGVDAESIVFETIGPNDSIDKKIILNIGGYNTHECLIQGTSLQHSDTEVEVVESTSEDNSASVFLEGAIVRQKIYSGLPGLINSDLLMHFYFKYIWPINSGANDFKFFINSCRYYPTKEKATVIVKVYPDIRWTLIFFLNLTNELGVAWKNFSPVQHKKMQKKSGKIGAEKRWKQKDASLGFSLDAEWNKLSKDSFQRKKSFKAEYETKFKKLYDLFSSLGNITEGITNKTKGTVRNRFKNIPIAFAIKPPNLNIKGVWQLERAQKGNQPMSEIGTNINIEFNASPLIGLEVTIDLLGATVGAVAGAVSGGAAAPGAMRIYGIFMDKINKGINFRIDDLKVKSNLDIYVDLVISNVISTNLGFVFNTIGDSTQKIKLELSSKLGVELKAGVLVKGELGLVVFSANTYFKAHASGKASITFGHRVEYDDQGLYYIPQLGFDGLSADYIIVASAGLSIKKGNVKIGNNEEYTIAEGKFDIIEPFDVIQSLEELWEFDSKIPLIRK